MKCILWHESWQTGALIVDREFDMKRPPRVIETPNDPSLDRAPPVLNVTSRVASAVMPSAANAQRPVGKSPRSVTAPRSSASPDGTGA